MNQVPEGFPFYMNDEDIQFFHAAGFQHISMAEVRRFGEFGKQTIELMTANGGYWTAHYGTFWEGPKALTCQAAYVAAELEGWGDPPGDIGGLAKLAATLRAQRMRRELKDNFTG